VNLKNGVDKINRQCGNATDEPKERMNLGDRIFKVR